MLYAVEAVPILKSPAPILNNCVDLALKKPKKNKA